MFYKLEFLEKKISVSRWKEIFELFRTKLKSFKVLVRYENASLHFYLECSKTPQALNTAIHPLQIGSRVEIELPKASQSTFAFISEDLLELIIKRTTAVKSAQQSAFWVQINFGLASRIHSSLYSFELLNRTAEGWLSVKSLMPVNAYQFLGFDLSKSSAVSLDQAKPKLQSTVDTLLPYDKYGSMHISEQSEERIDLSRVDFWRHSLVVGQSGSGKSEFLKLFVKELYFRGVTDKHGIVVLDPHGRIYDELSDSIPCACLHPAHHLINFFESTENPLAAAELSIDLLESQLANHKGKKVSLLDVVNNNSVTVVSLPQGELGSRLVKLYGATIVQQLFLSAQANKLNRPIVMILDELALFYTPAFDKILAESRKFGIGICAIQQYLSQIAESGLDSVFANVSNYFCFRTNRIDAELLAKNLNLQVDLLAEQQFKQSYLALAANTLSDLSVGELIAKLTVSGKATSATRFNTDLEAWHDFEGQYREVEKYA